MTRLVIHAGTHATGWAAVQRQLVSWRAPLEEIGVYLHPRDDLAELVGRRLPTSPHGTEPSALVTAADRAEFDDAEVLLLSSERLEDSLRDPERLAQLSSFADELGMPLTVLVVVRDQLGYLNHLYCERISHLQMARDFPTFSADPSPRRAVRLRGRPSTWRSTAPEIDFVAVPYADLRPGAEAKASARGVGCRRRGDRGPAEAGAARAVAGSDARGGGTAALQTSLAAWD